MKPYAPIRPSAKQRHFLNLDAEEALYGGAAGGGKSDALLLAALQYVDVPGYSAGIFRRTREDMNKPDAILQRAHTWFAGTAAKWDDKLHGYRFPTQPGKPDATIHFGFARDRQEVEDRYQGTTFHFLGVDEIGQWLEAVYLYLFSRVRRQKGMPVPMRVRVAGNPGGRGGEWVRARFVDHAKHVVTGETVRDLVKRRKLGDRAMQDPPYFASPPSSQALALARELGRKAQGAYFVPAYATDNPGLDLDEYRVNLARLAPEDRAQLEDGDWWAVAGGRFFKPEYFAYVDEPPPGLRWIRYWDLASTKVKKGKDPDWAAGVKVAVVRFKDGSRRVYIGDATRTRDDPGGVEAHVRGVAELDGKRVPVYLEEEPGSAGKANTHNYAVRILFGWQVHGHRKTGPKPEYWKALSAVARNGGLYLVRGAWNADFVAELCALTEDDSHAHDDQADAAAGGLDRLLEDSGAARFQTLANAL